MNFEMRKWREFVHEVVEQEEFLRPFMPGGWGLISFTLLYFSVLFLYSATNVILAHSSFLAAVLIPPVLTWRAWSGLSRPHNMAQQASIFFHTIRIWVLFLIIDRFTVALFLAPYDYIEPLFWLRIVTLLALQFFFWGIMSRLRWFHQRPHWFFPLILVPAASIFQVIESSGWLNLLLLAAGLCISACVLIDPSTGERTA